MKQCEIKGCVQATMFDQTFSRSILKDGYTVTVPEEIAQKVCGMHAANELSDGQKETK